MSKFNLLDEKWLAVISGGHGEAEEVTLKDLFINSHKYVGLAGETPTQDFAVFRFLQAVLYTVFTRFDAKGESYEWVSINKDNFQVENAIDDDDIDDYREALFKTWQDLWSKGKFPDIIIKYLEKYRHRFYLFDSKYPFFQFPEIGEDDYPYSATENSINKLNGRILEGDPKKPRLFMSQRQDELEYSAAARWLIYINGYAPSKSGNPGKKIKRDSTGVAYLGKLGGIYASGKNLFETLLLNLNLSKSTCVQKPIWEVEPHIDNFKSVPNNLAQLFTYPSRQLLLKLNDNNKVNKFIIDLAVSNFEYVPNLKLEPFTFWRYDKKLDAKKWNAKEGIVPKRLDPDKYFWQEMQTFSKIQENQQIPGVIEWLRTLQGEGIVSGTFSLNAVAEHYIQKDGVVDRQIYDRISENIGLLDNQENGWLAFIADQIIFTEQAIEKTIVRFAKDIENIRKTRNNRLEQDTKDQIFFAIDQRFKKWLASILPKDDMIKRSLEWKSVLEKEIKIQGERLIQESGNREYLGSYINKNGDKMDNIIKAYIRFKLNLKKEMGVK